MTDYERGLEQASSIYKEVIREYVAENAKLRDLLRQAIYATDDADWASIVSHAIELGVEVK